MIATPQPVNLNFTTPQIIHYARAVMQLSAKKVGSKSWTLTKCHKTGNTTGQCTFKIVVPPQSSSSSQLTCFGTLKLRVLKKGTVQYSVNAKGCVA